MRLARVGMSSSSRCGIGTSELVAIQLHIVNKHGHDDTACRFFGNVVLVDSCHAAGRYIARVLIAQSGAQAIMDGLAIFPSETLNDPRAGEFLATQTAKIGVA